MQDLVGNRVVISDPTGYMVEGDLERFEHDGQIGWAVLASARQVNYVDMQQSPPSVDAWEIPGVMRVATHLIARIHLTHLTGAAGPSEITQGPPKRAKKAKA